MSQPQEYQSQHQQQDKIEQVNALQAEVQQNQINLVLISDKQQLQQEDQKSNQQQQDQGKEGYQNPEKQTTTGLKTEGKDESSNKVQENQKIIQQTEPDQIQVQAVVISIDQQNQQQIRQQKEKLQKALEQELQRHIEKELTTGLKKVVKVTLCFVSIMIVLQTALMIAAIIARAQGTDCVR